MSFQLKKDLIHFLMADATLTGLISTRLYPHEAPQGTPAPYVVYSQVSGSQTHTHDGPTGNKRARFQFNVVGGSPASCEAVAEAIKGALEPDGGLHQAIGSSETTFVSRCTLGSEMDLGINEETRETEKALDFLINFNH